MSLDNQQNGEEIAKRYQTLYASLARQAGQVEPLSIADFDMLPFYADQALDGVDLEQTYPNFFDKLMGSSELLDAFIIRLGEVETLNLPSHKTDFGFLRPPNGIEVLTEQLSSWWQLAVTLTDNLIDDLLFGPGEPALVMRSGGMLQLDPQIISLVDEIVEVDPYELHVSLDGTLYPEDLMLELTLFLNEMDDQPLPERLSVEIRWGEIYFEKTIAPFEIVSFPKIPLTDLTGSDKRITHGIQLEISTSPT